MQESQGKINDISRAFQQEIAQQSNNGISITLNREEYDSLPNREYFK